MAGATTHVSFHEFANDIAGFFDRVIHDHETVVVENGAGEAVVLQPARPPRPRHARRHERTAADHEAFLSSFGGWSDVDDEDFINKIYESRNMPPRPPVEL